MIAQACPDNGGNELETHLSRVRLDYRTLWLETAAELGLVAETLADALGWQPSASEHLPDPLELAQAAAERIMQLEAQVVFRKITRQRIQGKSQHLAFSLN